MMAEQSTEEIIENAQIQQWAEANIAEDVEAAAEEDPAEVEEPAADTSAEFEEPEGEEAEEIEAEEPEEKEEPRISRTFARMKERERELQKQQRELHQQREELRPFKEAKDKSASGDMLGALEQVGWNYEKATTQVLQDGKLQPNSPNGQQVTPEVETKLQQLDDYVKKERVDKYVGAIKELVDGNENYGLIRSKWEETVPMLLQMQEISMRENQVVMDPDELLDKAEAYYENLIGSALSTEKGRKLYQSQSEAGESPQEKSSTPQRTRSRTLRNTASRPKSKSSRAPKTEREELEAAIAQVSWE